jgi:subtilisin family serine protease
MHRMRRLFLAFLATSVAAGVAVGVPTAASELPELAPVVTPAGETVPGSWIVKLRDGTSAADAAYARGVAERAGGRVGHTFTTVFNGFSVAMPEAALEGLRRNPQVEYIEADAVVTATATQIGAPWNLARLNQREPLVSQASYNFTYPDSGGRQSVVYVLDSGIEARHPEFGVRARFGRSFSRGTTDCNGHGTHVAGTIGSRTYGVAKNVQLVAVKILDCTGSGSTSALIAALNYVGDPTEYSGYGKVVNLSVGYTSFVPSVSEALYGLIAKGLTVVVSAGNGGVDACAATPANVTTAIVVSATGRADSVASFANTGSCVDIFAPGTDILSTWISPKKKKFTPSTRVMSGTSMAAAHVAGAAALLLTQDSALGPAGVEQLLQQCASVDAVVGAPLGTSGSLLYLAPEPLLC